MQSQGNPPHRWRSEQNQTYNMIAWPPSQQSGITYIKLPWDYCADDQKHQTQTGFCCQLQSMHTPLHILNHETWDLRTVKTVCFLAPKQEIYWFTPELWSVYKRCHRQLSKRCGSFKIKIHSLTVQLVDVLVRGAMLDTESHNELLFPRPGKSYRHRGKRSLLLFSQKMLSSSDKHLLRMNVNDLGSAIASPSDQLNVIQREAFQAGSAGISEHIQPPLKG